MSDTPHDLPSAMSGLSLDPDRPATPPSPSEFPTLPSPSEFPPLLSPSKSPTPVTRKAKRAEKKLLKQKKKHFDKPAHHRAVQSTHRRAVQTTPRHDLLLPSEPCAIDIEFQDFHVALAPDEIIHRLGRISIVNTDGDVVLDVYVNYPSSDHFYPRDNHPSLQKDVLIENGAKPAAEVEAWVSEILADRRVVMHGRLLQQATFQWVTNPWKTVATTNTQALYAYLQRNSPVSLGTVACEVNGRPLPNKRERDCVERAKVVMDLHQRLHNFSRKRAITAYEATQPCLAVVGNQRKGKSGWHCLCPVHTYKTVR